MVRKQVRVHALSFHDVFKKAGEKLVEHLRAFLQKNESVAVFLSGGSTAECCKPLVSFLKQGRYDPERLCIAQGDERFQPKNPRETNAERIGKTGIWSVCRKRGIERATIDQKGTLQAAARRYNETLADVFTRFRKKIGVFGIGLDGHTAGLLPNYRNEWEKKTWCIGYENTGEFKNRISITPKSIARMDIAILAGRGEGKREVIEKQRREKQGENDVFPARILHAARVLEIFSDRKAGKKKK